MSITRVTVIPEMKTELWDRSLPLITPPLPSICAGAVQSGDGFLSLLRHVQLFLALHRGPVPFHAAGWNVLSRETLLLLVHHCRMGWVSLPDFCLLILTIFMFFPPPNVSIIGYIAGTPTICVTVWAVLRLHFHDTGYSIYYFNNLKANMFYSRNLNREFYSVKSFTYDKRRLYKTHTSLSPPDVGTQTRTPPSGGWSKDPSWLPSWCVRRSLKLLLHCYIANGTHRHLFQLFLFS